jgi:hypothetical protein
MTDVPSYVQQHFLKPFRAMWITHVYNVDAGWVKLPGRVRFSDDAAHELFEAGSTQVRLRTRRETWNVSIVDAYASAVRAETTESVPVLAAVVGDPGTYDVPFFVQRHFLKPYRKIRITHVYDFSLGWTKLPRRIRFSNDAAHDLFNRGTTQLRLRSRRETCNVSIIDAYGSGGRGVDGRGMERPGVRALGLGALGRGASGVGALGRGASGFDDEDAGGRDAGGQDSGGQDAGGQRDGAGDLE